MSKAADKARELRWSERGHARLTARISRAANTELDRLAYVNGCTRRDAIEGLLLGNIRPATRPNPHGLSVQEQALWDEAGFPV